MDNLIKKLKTETHNSDYLIDESMREHTSFKIGGKADLFIDADPKELSAIINILEEKAIPITVLGNGSNVLVSDKGVRGAVICLGKNAKGIDFSEDELVAGAGELLSSVSSKACDRGFSGFEFATGIPGSVGGGVVMNAGAYDGEMSFLVKRVTCIDREQKSEISFLGKECEFDYRNSIFLDSKYIIKSVAFNLVKGNKQEIIKKVEDFTERRKSKQPLNYPSAGSTFKRPEGMFAGKLISDCNLKGVSVGGAMVSEKHAGFIVNKGNATAKDVKELIEIIQNRVYENFGVMLKREVRFVGEFD